VLLPADRLKLLIGPSESAFLPNPTVLMVGLLVKV